MRLGGVDPSILRELSGVYKPFVKAFKELISNAFDADALSVTVSFADDFSSVTVADTGTGMTPFEFRNDFTRIGGGSRRWTGDRTRKGRLRIGSKGIGFLALARYCDTLLVRSGADRTSSIAVQIPKPRKSFDLKEHLGVPLPDPLMTGRLKCKVVDESRSKQLKEGKDYELSGSRLHLKHDVGPLSIDIQICCNLLEFTATLDFDKLLRLSDTADLETVDEFATIDVIEVPKDAVRGGTTITAQGLKPFVRREFRSDRRKGFVRNIGSRSGLDQFVWNLSRCTPVDYVADGQVADDMLRPLLTMPKSMVLPDLKICHGASVHQLSRPIYPLDPAALPVHKDMIVEIRIDENGLKAQGFLAGYEGVIFPAEYRGISVRVRGVSIGDAGFFGAEHLATGANKAALSQITGEIIVLSGLDAADTLNPGRESFYEESEQYKVLRRHLIGDGEQIGGHLAKAISTVLRRSAVRSSLAEVLGRVTLRRRALDDVSAAITHAIGLKDDISVAIRKMLKSQAQNLNGLSEAPEHDLGAPGKIGPLNVVFGQNQTESAVVKYELGEVHLDRSRNEWNWSLQIHDRRFELVHKRGRPEHTIAEIDLRNAIILINWGHPIKQQMDERAFLRFALAWAIAKETAVNANVQTMDLALHLLSYTTESNA